MTASLSVSRVALALCALLSVPAIAASVQAAATPLQIKVLSNRADLISAGDALVEIVLAPGVLPSAVQVDVDGRDVTRAFALRSNGRFMGIVEGLTVGANVLTARAKGAATARITLTNHSRSGPVFAGPQVQPWFCTTDANGLGPATDGACNAPTTYEFFYRSTDPTKTGFQSYDPSHPPGDVATTVTDQGRVVPYIVRRETGTLDRGIYAIAVVFDPGQTWEPWAPQRGWNGNLVWPFGGDCQAYHFQGSVPDVLDDASLSKGFAVVSSTLNVLGQDCNEVVSAEAMMMVKEHVVERYGEVRYTIGNGCSGGSIQQHVIAASYPGLLDGIQPNCSYPDVWSTANEVHDCSLLLRYWNAAPELWMVEVQRAAVSGHATASNCEAWVEGFWYDRSLMDPAFGCDASATDVEARAEYLTGSQPDWFYNAETNRGGARCTIHDYQVAIWGRRLQDGFARRPLDNVGVQYGLVALQSGLILPEQFVDLNEKIGGYDIDMVWQPARSQADPESLAIAYRTGRVNDARLLARVPIIDLRGTSNFEIHTDFRSYAMRERLERANGTAGNQVIFTAQTPLVVPPSVAAEAFHLVDQWLAAIEADPSADPRETKVLRHKPPLAVDSCYIGETKVTDQATCRALFPYFGDPRIAAGGPLADDVMKCQLTPLDRASYNATFTDAQWARLQATFPTGVCDFTRPSVGRQPSVPWLDFSGGPGGQPLPPAPVSTATK
ncbi:MAG: hypothetical protein DMD81_07880 [Candidatus Rokuibacteriota bacterium]|nr:MAG: hypothetical protein DMD81_07880 [Candidatus Rokubacteria bacterium]